VTTSPSSKNPTTGYRQRGHLDQITFKGIGDSTAKLQALQSGGVALASRSRPRREDRPELWPGDHRPRRVLQSAQPRPQPERRRPGDHLCQQSVRTAVAEAVNKQSYVTRSTRACQVPTGFMPPATQGFKAETLPA